MRRIKFSDARNYFAERVKTNGKTLVDMTDIFRAHPGQFTHQDVDKVRIYLTRQVEAAVQAMSIAVTSAIHTDFDFDMELPAQDTTIRFYAGTVKLPSTPAITISPADQVPTRQKATGRLVREEGGGVLKEEVPLVPQRKAPRDTAGLSAEHDNTGMIQDSGFISDAE
jgi:hypothetical protein